MFLFKLALGKEVSKPMDLAIPMGQRDHSKEVVKMVKKCENYTLELKSSWSKSKIDMKNMPIGRHAEFEIWQMCG
jgi:hypothetical protein